MNARLSAGALSLLLAACAPLPRAVPDNAQVALPAAWSEAAPGSHAIDGTWWRQLGDAQLDALVAEALANNNDLLTALARVQEASANQAAADAARSPSLNFSTTAQAGRSLGALGPTHTRSVQPGVQAAWEPDLWGLLSAQSQAAGERLQATQADRDAVTLAVAAATAQTYVGLRSLQEQLAIAQATVQSRERPWPWRRTSSAWATSRNCSSPRPNPSCRACCSRPSSSTWPRAGRPTPCTCCWAARAAPFPTACRCAACACRPCPPPCPRSCWSAAPTSPAPRTCWPPPATRSKRSAPLSCRRSP